MDKNQEKKAPDETDSPVFIDRIDDLMRPEDYREASGRKKIRIRIKNTADGLELVGDSLYPGELEKLLADTATQPLKKVLCG